MLAAGQARANVDERLARIMEGDHALVGLDVVRYTCIGTDVLAQDLQLEVMACAHEFALKVAKGANLIDCLNGAVLRTFWLGYEYGKAAD